MELSKVVEYKNLESSKKYISGIIIEICCQISNILLNDPNLKIYKHQFNPLENNYVLKKLKDSLINQFSNLCIELDGEYKFLIIDWSSK